MSHAARAALPKLKDLAILEKATKRIKGWTTARNATVRSYYNSPKKFELVLINPDYNGYDLGVIKNKDGTLTLEGDLSMLEYQDGFKAMGKGYQNLIQAYSVEEEIVKLQNVSLGVLESKLENGTIVLEVELENSIV